MSAQDAQRRVRVVVADDHAVVREGLVSVLREHCGFEVVGEAADGLMAVEVARRTHPDVVLMDVNMPRMNGIEATRLLAQSLPQVKVVGLSMHDAQEIQQAMRAAGAADYLPKHVNASELCRRVRAVAAGEAPAPPT